MPIGSSICGIFLSQTRGGTVIKRSTVSTCAIFVCLLAVPAMASSPSCFTPDEAKAAHLRVMQQEFNVAALNCQTTDPSAPTFSNRYNDFVTRFSGVLRDNATALRRHFSRAGGNLDVWMTKVANDAGHRVLTDPEYCQQAWDYLDKALTAEVIEVDGLAASMVTARATVPVCAEPAVKGKATKAKASKASVETGVRTQ
jgi:hypothetical protein